MTDLRKAAEMALEALEIWEKMQPNTTACAARISAAEALRQALAQPEQDYEVAHNADGTFSIALPDGDELRIVPPKREWVGLTDEEIEEYKWMGQDVIAVIKEIQATLKEKNGG